MRITKGFFFQCTDQGFAIAEFAALQRFGQARGDFLRRLHPDVGHQQLVLELLQHVIVDLLFAQQQIGQAARQVFPGFRKPLAQGGEQAGRLFAVLFSSRFKSEHRFSG
jgi:hypothetical protein